MTYQLSTERWIPARDAQGTKRWIAPHEIVGDGPWTPEEIDSPRADLRAALYQFLIGLLYTTAAPANERQWRKWYETPPTSDELARVFREAALPFDLLHPETPFMQERGLEAESADVEPIAELLIDVPGGKTLKENKDHFVKRRRQDAYCLSCAAAALYALQLNAPQGGAGIRTGLRGGGPLTTLVLGPDLWRSIWLNVLPRDKWGSVHDAEPSWQRFPWANVEPASHGEVRFEQAHPDLHFWAMPRRIELVVSAESAECTLCARQVQRITRGTRSRPRGWDYKDPWNHPLSPTTETSEGLRVSAKGNSGIQSFREWLGLVQANEAKKRKPALVVQHLRAERAHRLHPGEVARFRLWAFGYEMAIAKVIAWHESTLPLHHVPEAAQASLEAHAEALILSAEQAQSHLTQAVKSAWSRRPADLKGDLRRLGESLWRALEPAFHQELDEAASIAEDEARLGARRAQWLVSLQRSAMRLFREWTAVRSIGDVNPKQIVDAEVKLRLNLNSKRMHDALRISTFEPEVVAS